MYVFFRLGDYNILPLQKQANTLLFTDVCFLLWFYDIRHIFSWVFCLFVSPIKLYLGVTFPGFHSYFWVGRNGSLQKHDLFD